MSYVTPNENEGHKGLVLQLSADLAPVGRLWPPALRALSWLGVVVVFAALLALFSNLSAMTARLTALPDMWLAATGSALTAVLATVAAFQLSFPDRSPLWALSPVPALLLWIGTSSMGCLRTLPVPGTHDASPAEAKFCLFFILALSTPLSIVLFKMLQRAYSLRPGLTAMMGGLAAAAASATVLNLFHPYDAAATDLAFHALAVAIVVTANCVLNSRLLRA